MSKILEALKGIKKVAQDLVEASKEEVIEEVVLEKTNEIENAEVVDMTQEKTNLMQETLENGAVLEAEAFEAGQPVFIVNEDERIPLPVGEYKVGDEMLVVEEEGIIAEMKKAEEAPAEEEMGSEFVTKEEFNDAINEIKSLLSSHKEKLDKEKEVLENKNVELQTALDETPAAPVIKHSPEQKEFKADTPTGRIVEAIRKVS